MGRKLRVVLSIEPQWPSLAFPHLERNPNKVSMWSCIFGYLVKIRSCSQNFESYPKIACPNLWGLWIQDIAPIIAILYGTVGVKLRNFSGWLWSKHMSPSNCWVFSNGWQKRKPGNFNAGAGFNVPLWLEDWGDPMRRTAGNFKEVMKTSSWQSSRKQGPGSCCCKVLNPVHNLHELRKRFLPRASRLGLPPTPWFQSCDTLNREYRELLSYRPVS